MKGDDTLILTAVLSREEDVYIAECPPFLGEARAPADSCTDFPMEEGGRPIITTFEVAGHVQLYSAW